MARLTVEEEALRHRIYDWIRYYWTLYEPHDHTQKVFAKRFRLAEPTVSELLSRRGACGLKVLHHMREYLGADLNLVLEENPPSTDRRRDPAQASPVHVEPKRRKGADG